MIDDQQSTPLIEPDDALPPASLAELDQDLRAAAGRAGWTELTAVQARAIPYLLAGRDLMIQSRTGSGKTGAYLLPILARIDCGQATCQALVLVPTRELAKQVAHEAAVVAGDSGVRAVAVYGGVGYGPQFDALRQGAHLVVGTPGRVLDHLLRRSLRLDALRVLVFDEADRMLSMGFYPDMVEVQRFMPDHEVSVQMFSATFPEYIKRLASRFMRQPELLSLSGDHVHVTEMAHVCYEVPTMDKDRSLVRIIEVENPPSALVFCNTRERVHYVTVVLQRFGYDADELSSDLGQDAREAILSRLRRGELRFLVATDVAARGIDIPSLGHVIIYETPEDPEGYIHRAGRTGRLGAFGQALSLVDGAEWLRLRHIAKHYGISLERREVPTDEDVARVVSERATALLEARLRHRDRLQVERMARFVPLVEQLAADEEGRGLLAMLVDDFYHQAVHAAVASVAADEDRPRQEVSSAAEPRRRRGRRESGKRSRY